VYAVASVTAIREQGRRYLKLHELKANELLSARPMIYPCRSW